MTQDLSFDKEQFAASVNDAVKALKAAVEDFAKTASEGRNSAASAVKKAGANATDQLTAFSGDAQDYVDRGAVGLAKTVAGNPLTALALAAGAGLLIGLATRGDRK